MKIFELAVWLTVVWIVASVIVGCASYRLIPYFPTVSARIRELLTRARKRNKSKRWSTWDYFFHNAKIGTIALVATVLIFKTIFLVRLVLFLSVSALNIIVNGGASGLLLATEDWLVFRKFMRYVLTHGILETLGMCIFWAMVLLGLWSTIWVAIGLLIILVAGYIEANVSDPFIRVLRNNLSTSHQ